MCVCVCVVVLGGGWGGLGQAQGMESTLKPASLAKQKQSATAATVWPLFVSRATSSYVL